MCQHLIHVSSKPIKFCFSVPISLPRPFPCPTGSTILLSPCQGHFSVLAAAGTVAGGSEGKEEERRDSGQTLLVWRPGGHPAWATACHCEKWHHPLLRIVRAKRQSHGARHTHRHWWRGRYAHRQRSKYTLTHKHALRQTDIKRIDSQISTHILTPIQMWMYYFLKLYWHTLSNNAGHYRRAQRSCTGLGKLYDGVNSLDDKIHSNTATLSADRLGGQIATISHHLSADLQATHDFLRGPAGRYCTQFLSDSLYSSLTSSASGFCLCYFKSTTLLLYLLLNRLTLKSQTGKRPRCRHKFGVSEEIDFVVNEVWALLSQGVTGQNVIISPLCHSHTEHRGGTTVTI